MNECVLDYKLTHTSKVILLSPLFPQRGLNFTHSDQGAEVFHLRADFRHVQAAHVVDVFTQPSRLWERGVPLVTFMLPVTHRVTFVFHQVFTLSIAVPVSQCSLKAILEYV